MRNIFLKFSFQHSVGYGFFFLSNSPAVPKITQRAFAKMILFYLNNNFKKKKEIHVGISKQGAGLFLTRKNSNIRVSKAKKFCHLFNFWDRHTDPLPLSVLPKISQKM